MWIGRREGWEEIERVVVDDDDVERRVHDWN